QVVRERLLDVHVLPCGAGVHGDRHVPVVGRGDQDGIDLFKVEDTLVILGGPLLAVPPPLGFGQIYVPDVTNRGNVDLGNLNKGLHQVSAPAAAANEANLNGVVSVLGVHGRHAERRQPGSRGSLEKSPTSGHGTTSLGVLVGKSTGRMIPRGEGA